MITTSLEDQMKTEAEFGLFYCKSKMSKKKAAELRLIGFEVTDMKTSNGYPRLHYITWRNASVEDPENSSPDRKLTLSQELWLISMKNRPKF